MSRSIWKGPFVDGYLLKKAEILITNWESDFSNSILYNVCLIFQYIVVLLGNNNFKKNAAIFE